MGSLPGFLAAMACGLSGGACWVQRPRKSDESGGRLGKDGLWDPQEMWARGRKAAAGVLLPC